MLVVGRERDKGKGIHFAPFFMNKLHRLSLNGKTLDLEIMGGMLNS